MIRESGIPLEAIAKSDLSISICSLKSTLKKHILSQQKSGTFYEWYSKNFHFFLKKLKLRERKKI